MQDGKKVKEMSETGEIEIYDIIEDEEIEPEKDPLIDELGELNDTEKAILDRMRGVKQEPEPADPESETDWISVSVGQPAKIAGVRFKISHISKGFLILEADESQQEEDKEKEAVWTQLQCTGARSLIRIDGTPFYVETRILSGKEEDKNSGEQDAR